MLVISPYRRAFCQRKRQEWNILWVYIPYELLGIGKPRLVLSLWNHIQRQQDTCKKKVKLFHIQCGSLQQFITI